MKTNIKKRQEKIEHEIGSGNVFSDLGFENAEEELLKSNLTAEIAYIIRENSIKKT